MIDGLVALMATREGFCGPLNLGNPAEFSIRELAEKVLSLTGSKSKIEKKPLPQDDPRQRRPDIALAKKEIDWQPKVTLEDGLKETIRYFKDLLKS
jgi:UDP-glucuronate decarboxylase